MLFNAQSTAKVIAGRRKKRERQTERKRKRKVRQTERKRERENEGKRKVRKGGKQIERETNKKKERRKERDNHKERQEKKEIIRKKNRRKKLETNRQKERKTKKLKDCCTYIIYITHQCDQQATATTSTTRHRPRRVPTAISRRDNRHTLADPLSLSLRGDCSDLPSGQYLHSAHKETKQQARGAEGRPPQLKFTLRKLLYKLIRPLSHRSLRKEEASLEHGYVFVTGNEQHINTWSAMSKGSKKSR